MSSIKFFEQMTDEFEGHPYRDRFLQELQDHLEDAEENGLNKNQLIVTLFEKPRAIRATFLDIMNPWHHFIFMVRAMLFSVNFVIVGVMLFRALKIGVYSNFVLSNYSILSLTIISLFIYWLYELGFSTFYDMEHETTHTIKLWFLALILPSLLIFIWMAFRAWELSAEYSSSLYWVGVLAWLAINYLNFIVGYYIQKSHKKDKLDSRIWGVFVFIPALFLITLMLFLDFNEGGMAPYLLFLTSLFLYFIFFVFYLLNYKRLQSFSFLSHLRYLFFFLGALMILGRTLLTYYPIELSSSETWLFFPLYLIFFLDTFFEMVWSFTEFGSFFALILPILFLVFSLGEGFVVSIQKKNWFQDYSMFLLYSLSFLFINPQPFLPNFDFQVPFLNVSGIIESEKLGIFYNYVKYFNVDRNFLFDPNADLIVKRNHLFQYDIEMLLDPEKKPYFMIENNFNDRFTINIESLKDDFSTNSIFILNTISDQEHGFDLFDQNLALKGSLPDLMNCISLDCSADAFLEADGDVIDYIFSPDKKWLLLTLSESSFGAQGVYLLMLN